MSQCLWPRFCTPVVLSSLFYIKSGISEFLWISDSCECHTLHSNFLWHFKHTLWPSALDLDFPLIWLYDLTSSLSIKVWCCEGVIAACVKPYVVIVLALDLDIMFKWLCPDFTSGGIKVCFCEVVIAASIKPCIVIVLDILFKHTHWPDALDLSIALKWLCPDFKSSIKVHSSVAVIVVSVKPSIVQALTWPCALDQTLPNAGAMSTSAEFYFYFFSTFL